MPIPLIIWGVAIAASAITGGVSTAAAAGRIDRAKRRYAERRKAYEAKMREFEAHHALVGRRVALLVKTRLSAMELLGEAVRFLEKAKLKDRSLEAEFKIAPEKMVAWKTAALHAHDVLGGAAKSVASGVATASAAYGLVGLLGAASTGTAISTLGGAAATNATLAWLGGGALAAGGGGIAAGTMVLGGVAVGPALLVVSFVAHSKAGDIENRVETHIAEMDKDEAEKARQMACLDVLVRRSSELRGSTLKMMRELRRLLRVGNPSDHRDAYLVARTAKGLGELIEVAIFDSEGKPLESAVPA